jgi:hypothetical protein
MRTLFILFATISVVGCKSGSLTEKSRQPAQAVAQPNMSNPVGIKLDLREMDVQGALQTKTSQNGISLRCGQNLFNLVSNKAPKQGAYYTFVGLWEITWARVNSVANASCAGTIFEKLGAIQRNCTANQEAFLECKKTLAAQNLCDGFFSKAMSQGSYIFIQELERAKKNPLNYSCLVDAHIIPPGQCELTHQGTFELTRVDGDNHSKITLGFNVPGELGDLYGTMQSCLQNNHIRVSPAATLEPADYKEPVDNGQPERQGI